MKIAGKYLPIFPAILSVYCPKPSSPGAPPLRRSSSPAVGFAGLPAHASGRPLYYFHNQLNGCPAALTDSKGTITWRMSSTLWGKTQREKRDSAVETEQNLRFQGQYFDRESGLYYNLFRLYDPDIGRFTQQDPIGLMGGINLYAYAPNPLTWIDPLGLKLCAFGNKSEPKGIRDRDLAPNEHGILPSQADKARPQGKSVTRTPGESGLQWHYHTIPDDVKMPDGLGIKHDGRDMPGGYMSPGHSTIYPTRDMTPEEFNKLFESLPWDYGGKI